mmetsp:Transcript_8656/g.12902  ORF Transcript_8656/g.12902 Transcript_8656/m.12902 type:complete len:122 (-) Transcript_8656:78-443(-)
MTQTIDSLFIPKKRLQEAKLRIKSWFVNLKSSTPRTLLASTIRNKPVPLGLLFTFTRILDSSLTRSCFVLKRCLLLLANNCELPLDWITLDFRLLDAVKGNTAGGKNKQRLRRSLDVFTIV